LGFGGQTSRLRHFAALHASFSKSALRSTFQYSKKASRAADSIKSCASSARIYTRGFHTSLKLFQTHYEILGLSKTATIAEIQKAYRTKAKLYHPDRNKEPNAQAKFVAVKEAYECLKDPLRRGHYDSTLPGSGMHHNTGPVNRNAGYRAPNWANRETERKMWEDLKARHHSHRHQWKHMHKEMDEEIRRNQEHDALVRKLSPFFNAALILSLVAIGATSLYLQYRNRGPPGHVRSFSSVAQSPDDIAKVRNAKNDFSKLVLQEAEDYRLVDPHHKYRTRWDDINEAVKKRDDFYRTLLAPNATRPEPRSEPSKANL